MANRNIQAKLRKLRRRYRFARFSGGQTRFVSARIEIKDGKEVVIPVGPISLSNQVPKGQGPNQERMQQYYNSVKPENFEKPIPPRTSEVMAAWLKQYHDVLNETPKYRRLNLAFTREGRLDMFFSTEGVYLVEVNYKLEFFRKSREYSDKKTALDRLKNNRITWVEQFPK